MEFRKVLALRGPNIWARFSVLEVWVDLGDLVDTSSDSVPGFIDRLLSWLPSLVEHKCSVGRRGGFIERLQRGTYPAHILEHVTIELQILAGTPVAYGKARASNEARVYKVIVEYHEEELAKAALNAARRLLLAALYDQAFEIEKEVATLSALKQEVALGPSTQSIVSAALSRGIPYRRLTEGSLVQFGHGARQRRILAAETDATPAIAEWIAQDKQLTRKLLQQISIPVPYGYVVSGAEEAWSAAEEIGLPVVVKPQHGNQGRGVATNLTTKSQILAAFHSAKKEGTHVIIETFAPGEDWRVLVVGDKVVAAARRQPARVIGDGHSTIRSLIEVINSDPRRSDGHATALSWIKLDEVALAVLAEQNYTPESIPEDGQVVLIRRNANLSTGGTAEDVTDQVHPLVAARCVEASKMVGLDICGVDVVAVRIDQPLEQQGGVIVEVNAGPGLRMHLEPSSGTPRDVGAAIVDSIFAPGNTGRIPIVAVTGTNGKTTTTRLTAHIIRQTGQRTGMTCTDGIYVDDRQLDSGDCAGPGSAAAVLMHPCVDAAVLETARGGILRAGLGFDCCDVAVVTNIAEGDHLGISDIETVEELAVVKRCIVRAVKPDGSAVLNADDPLTVDMHSYCAGRVVFFSRNKASSVLISHRENGGAAAFTENNVIVLAQGSEETPLIDLKEVPLTHSGRIGFQVENALASAAAAWSLGVALDDIRKGLQTFVADGQQAPGRFNLFLLKGATVVIDYAHNTSALKALLEALDCLPHRRRAIVFTVAGDRRNEDITDQGELLGNYFDVIRLYEDGCTRGRADGEVTALIRDGLEKATRPHMVIESRGERATVEASLAALELGDLLVLQPDDIDAIVQFVRQCVALERSDDGASLNVPAKILIAGEKVTPSISPAQALSEKVAGKRIGLEEQWEHRNSRPEAANTDD